MDEQYALDWDCEPNWDHIDLDDRAHIPPDLSGQGLTYHQLATITDVPLTGRWL